MNDSVQEQRFFDCLGFTHQQFEDILNTGLYDRLALDYEIANFTRVQRLTSDRDFLDVWNKNLSDNEKFSPLKKAVIPMLNLLPNEVWTDPDTTFLDPCVKSARYLLEIEKRLIEHGFSKENARSRIFGVATSKIGWLVANKRYYGDPEHDGNIFYVEDYINKIKGIGKLKFSKKELGELTIEEKKNEKYQEFYKLVFNEKGVDVKINVIVGNPPYQGNTQGNSEEQIYNYFFDAAKSFIPEYLTMIHPAKFLFNAGGTPKSWNNIMLNDPHLSVPVFELNPSKIFPATDIKGGICITLWKKFANVGLGGAFYSTPELCAIKEKVNVGGFETIISSQTKVNQTIDSKYPNEKRIRSNWFAKFPETFVENPDKNHTIKILGLIKNKRVFRYLDKKLVNDPSLEKWKVFLPESNGSGAIGEVLSTPLVGEPLVGCTHTFMQIGSFGPDKPYSEWTCEENDAAKQQAENLMKYIKTKFCRTLLGTLKITQRNPKDVWTNVPLLSFDNRDRNVSPPGTRTIPQSNFLEETGVDASRQFRQDIIIDWTKSIPEIDEQLFDAFKLDETERKFINDNIKEMK
jgi:hypothetical protein